MISERADMCGDMGLASRVMMKAWRCAGALILLVPLAGCGESFEERDPNGALACQALADGRQSANFIKKTTSLVKAGEHAWLAETDAIEESVINPGGAAATTPLADVDELAKACEAEGFDMPVDKN